MPRVKCVGLAGALVLLSYVPAAAQALVLANLDGTAVRPFESRAPAFVFVFSRTDCPVAGRYAPYFERLQHRLAGATTTPEAAVFVRHATEPTLVYRGRIDDRYVDIGRTRPAPTRHDLDEVIAAIRSGRTPALRSTPAVGCLIADVSR